MASADLEEVGQATTSSNGVSINGISINGISINGISINGISINGISINGVSINGSELVGTGSNGPIAGAGWLGATMSAQLAGGGELVLRVAGVETLATPNDDVWVYDVRYRIADGSWAPLCTVDGSPGGAMALAGTWNLESGVPGGGNWNGDTDRFTFACRGSALAKCVELGYQPWDPALRDHHQACTRMIRADYCGDGTPHTFNGWRLDLFDDIGIQAPTPGLAGWGFEAHWGTGGASCMSSFRALDLIVSAELPACVAERLDPGCRDDGFTDGSLLQNYFDPWGINVALEDAYRRYPAARNDLAGAMTLIDKALTLLTQQRPRDAAQKIEQAVTKIKSGLNKDLPAAFGRDLMKRYALVVRSSLVFEIETRVVSASKVAAARSNLAHGDERLAAGEYPNATNAYKNGIGNLY
jgi:hypothetical protein